MTTTREAAEKAGIVRKLEWHGPDYMDEFTAPSPFGLYVIGRQTNRGRWAMGDYHQTVEAAQAAVQADYDTQVSRWLNPDYLSALDTARAEIEGWRKRYDDSSDYSIDLQRIIEDLTHSRPIREPQTTAHFHYDMAVAYQSALTAAQARIAELEGKASALVNLLDDFMVVSSLTANDRYDEAIAALRATLSPKDPGASDE